MEATHLAVIFARLQFYITIAFHFLWPPMTIGLGWLIFWMIHKYRKTGDEMYQVMAKFWLGVFTLGFAVGVATGLTMEFQFGTNWSEYSRFVGDIFGSILAAEVITAFFLESTFLGILVFGWKKLSTRALWFASLMVASGSTLSAFWILAANSWQQTPAGYKILNGRPVLDSFWTALFNHTTIDRFLHTIGGAILTGAFVMLSISAWFLLKKRHVEFAKRSFKMAVYVAFVFVFLQLIFGHYQAITVWKNQPIKLASYEGLFETRSEAPFLIFGIPDSKNEKMLFDIAVPGLMSWLLTMDSSTVVKGIKDFPKDERPPLLPTFAGFHLMVGMWFLMVAGALLGVVLLFFNRLENATLYLKLMMFSFLLPTLSNQFGWIATEVGRQPWVVWGMLRTKDAVSITVPWYQVLLTLLMFIGVYTLLFYAFWILLKKKMEIGPDPLESDLEKEVPA